MNKSKLDICNMALAILGQVDMSSLTEENQRARLCNQYYDIVRQQLLRAHDWSFAKATAKLSLIRQETNKGVMEFVYSKPAKSLFITKIYNEGQLEKAGHFRLEYDSVKKEEVIRSQVENAMCEYTRDVEETSLYDSQFVEAFSAALAAKMAMSLTGSTQLYQMAVQTYQYALDNARYTNKVERLETAVFDNPYLTARE